MPRRAGRVSGASSRSSGTPPLEGGGRSQFGHNLVSEPGGAARREPHAVDTTIPLCITLLASWGASPGGLSGIVSHRESRTDIHGDKGDSHAEDLRIRRYGRQETARAVRDR